MASELYQERVFALQNPAKNKTAIGNKAKDNSLRGASQNPGSRTCIQVSPDTKT